jgi:hypothetical protein
MKTIEEKAKRYDEVLEELRGLLEGIREEKREILEEDITNIFPELEESEDEKIRKSIIHALHGDGFLDMEETNKAIAWLEKQGEQKVPINDFKAKNWYVSEVDGKIHDMTYNPADKVEPKFKVDWIVGNKDNSVSHESDYHLWSIKDAKDGDVLVYNNSIFIFNEIYKNCLIYYGIYENDKFYDDKCYSYLDLDTIDINNIHPATKEQRELLFQKMTEAGYKWDTDKKELKKIKMQELVEQNPVWSEEDEGILDEIIDFLENGTVKLQHDLSLYASWLKSLKGRVGCEVNCTTTKEWSVEDMSKIQKICKYLDEAKKYYADITEVRECTDWLKSLKEREQPHPKQEWSKEDDTMLNVIIADLIGFSHSNTSTLESHFNGCIDWLKSIKDRYI